MNWGKILRKSYKVLKTGPQIYKLSAVGDRNEVIRVWGKKIKSQGHSDTKYSRISSFGGIFSAASGMRGQTSMKLSQLLITMPNWHWSSFLRSWVQRSQTNLSLEADCLVVVVEDIWFCIGICDIKLMIDICCRY